MVNSPRVRSIMSNASKFDYGPSYKPMGLIDSSVNKTLKWLTHRSRFGRLCPSDFDFGPCYNAMGRPNIVYIIGPNRLNREYIIDSNDMMV